MQKIIRIIARLNVGGPAIHVTNLCDLDKHGYETVLIYGSVGEGEGDMSYLLKDKNIKSYYIPELGREISPLKDLNTLWRIFKIIRKEKPDIVHTHTAKAGMLGRVAAKIAGVGHIYHTFHGHVFNGYFSKNKTAFFIFIEKILAKITTKIVAISQLQLNEISEILNVNKNKFELIPLGFELERFVVGKKGFLKENNINNDFLNIAIVGRVTDIKNHKLFMDVLKEISNKGVKFNAFVVGDGELKEFIKDYSKKLGLEKNIYFTGWIRDLTPVYSAIDYLFLTSKNEGTPVAIIEAMAAGKIVISTNVGGVSDIVKDGENGFTVNTQTPLSFAEKFLTVNSLPEEKKNMVRQKAQDSSSKFSIENLLENIRKLYTS